MTVMVPIISDSTSTDSAEEMERNEAKSFVGVVKASCPVPVSVETLLRGVGSF